MLLRHGPRRVALSWPIARVVDRCALEPNNFSLSLVTLMLTAKAVMGGFPALVPFKSTFERIAARDCCHNLRALKPLLLGLQQPSVRAAWCGRAEHFVSETAGQVNCRR